MKVGDLSAILKQHWPSIGNSCCVGPTNHNRATGGNPEADGGVRKLGIPTLLDRLIQQAVMQVLQRRWAPTFSEHSHGFRPNARASSGSQGAAVHRRRPRGCRPGS